MPSSPALPTEIDALTADGTPSQLLPSLVRAYRDAWYEVVLPPPHAVCTLQVGIHHPVLHTAMQQLGAMHACLLTACNPQGDLLSPDDNAQRMRALREALAQAGWKWAPALGRDPQHQWPGEDSLLVWHMGPAQARDWGRRWEQNAVLIVGADAIPQLLLLR